MEALNKAHQHALARCNELTSSNAEWRGRYEAAIAELEETRKSHAVRTHARAAPPPRCVVLPIAAATLRSVAYRRRPLRFLSKPSLIYAPTFKVRVPGLQAGTAAPDGDRVCGTDATGAGRTMSAIHREHDDDLRRMQEAHGAELAALQRQLAEVQREKSALERAAVARDKQARSVQSVPCRLSR
jgi:hypothetical protein